MGRNREHQQRTRMHRGKRELCRELWESGRERFRLWLPTSLASSWHRSLARSGGRAHPDRGGRRMQPWGLLASIPQLLGALVRLENSISITGRAKAEVSRLGRQPRHSFPCRNPSQSLEHPRIYLLESWRPPTNEAAMEMWHRGA